MLFETLLQPQIFLFLALWGFVCGFLYDISAYIIFLCKNNKIVRIVFDFICTMCVFLIFYYCVLRIDYGDLRFYHGLTFGLFLILQRITLGKLIAKVFDRCYTLFIKVCEKISRGLQKIKWKKTDHNKS